MSLLRTKCFHDGIGSALPIAVAFSVIFFSQGLLSYAEGLTATQAIALTIGIFAAPTQNYIIDNMTMPLWMLLINVFLLNFKFFLMASIMVAFWKSREKLVLPAIYMLTSSSYLVAIVKKHIHNPIAFFIGLAATTYVVAITCTALGFFVAEHARHMARFLSIIAHVVVPLHFACLTMKRKHEPVVIALSMAGFFLPPLLIQVMPKTMNTLVWFAIAGFFVWLDDTKEKQKNAKEIDTSLDPIVHHTK